MEEALIREIISLSRRAVKSRLLERGDCVSARTGDLVYITRERADLSALRVRDIERHDLVRGEMSVQPERFAQHARIYGVFPKKKAVISVSSPFILTMARAAQEVKPLVDDTAQIVGVYVRCAGNADPATIARSLKGRNAALVGQEGAVCADVTLDDTFATLQVLDKACRIQIESAFIGGAKAINRIEATLMRLVYLKMYSKRAVQPGPE